MLRRLGNIPTWLILVLATLSIALGLRGAYNVGGMDSVLWALALAAPGVVCVGGFVLFLRWRLKDYRLEKKL